MHDMRAINPGVIEEFRANNGVVGGPWAGIPMLLLTTTGAKSGAPRLAPLFYTTDGDRFVVIASNGGSPVNPPWIPNLVAHPRVTVEVGGETFPARASIATGEERARLFAEQARLMPVYKEFQAQTSRELPVVVLERLDS